MRTGSTWLHEYLSLRNDICLPKGVKETFYFATNYAMGEGWYRNYFRHYDPIRHRSIIEICPTSFHDHDAIGRIKKTLDEPRLLVTLRDPIDRAWSQYMHLCQHGETALDFDVAVREIPTIVAPGLYAKHLTRWLDEFGREAVRTTFFDDLKERQPEYVRQVNDAFGLSSLPLQTLPGKKINSGGLPYNRLLAKTIHRTVAKLRHNGLHWVVNTGKRVGLSDIIYGRSSSTATRQIMSLSTHNYLVEQFSTDVDNLEGLLNINLDSWRKKWVEFREKSDPI